jgi:hypothetical protein
MEPTTGRRRVVPFGLIAITLVTAGALSLVAVSSSSGARAAPGSAWVHTVGASATATSTPPTTAPTTTVPTTTPTTVPTTTPPPPVAAPASTTAAPTTPTTAPPAQTSGDGCAAALAYLAANANPEFSFVCPGYALGHQAMTCVNVAGVCAGEHVIVINDPCPAAYMNEAYNSNSWSDSLGEFTRPIDPYGSC